MSEQAVRAYKVPLEPGVELEAPSDDPELVLMLEGELLIRHYEEIQDMFMWRTVVGYYCLGVIYGDEMLCWIWGRDGGYLGVGYVSEQKGGHPVHRALADAASRKDSLPVSFPNGIPKGKAGKPLEEVSWRPGIVAES